MVAVVVVFEAGNSFVVAEFVVVGESLNTGAAVAQHLFFGDAANDGEFGIHRYVVQIVEVGENAETGESTYAGENRQANVAVATFEVGVYGLKNVAEFILLSLFVNV